MLPAPTDQPAQPRIITRVLGDMARTVADGSAVFCVARYGSLAGQALTPMSCELLNQSRDESDTGRLRGPHGVGVPRAHFSQFISCVAAPCMRLVAWSG